MINKIIKLGGFGELDKREEKELREVAEKFNTTLNAGYYDFFLEGKREDIEKVTLAQWGMPEDQWEENCLLVY